MTWGKTVLPGFIDAHSHPAYSGLTHLREVDADLRSIAEIQAAIRKRAAETPPGQWVLAFKYDDIKTREGRPLTRQDMDAAAPNHPVRIYHRGGHTAYVNSLAMKLAGVSENTPDPAGGSFDRDSSGRLTGKLKDTATEPFDKLIPSTYTREERREGVKLITRMMTRTGVTSVTDAYGDPEDLVAWPAAIRRGPDRLPRTNEIVGATALQWLPQFPSHPRAVALAIFPLLPNAPIRSHSPHLHSSHTSVMRE